MRERNFLIKPVSGLCNMKCEYCFYTDEMDNRKQASYGMMQDDVMEQVIKKTLAATEKTCTFLFQGGEPMLAGRAFYEKWLAYEKKYNQNKITISHALQTNGALVDADWCRFWAENEFLIGLSLDGVKATHDAYRKDRQGNGTYLQTLAAAEQMQSAGINFNVLTVVHQKTARKIQRIYEAYQRRGFAWQQYIACLDPLYEPPGSKAYSLSPEVYGQFLIDLFRLWRLDLENGRQPYIRQFENYTGILLGYEPESCEQKGICSFQNVIEADGSVYPCDFYVLDAYKLGNLCTQDFEMIEQRQKESNFISRCVVPDDACISCEYYYLCRGGCCRHRMTPAGTYGRNCFCQSYQMFFRACLPEMERIAKQLSNQGRSF